MPRKKREMTEEEQIKYHAYRFFLLYNGLKNNNEGKNRWNDLPDANRDAYIQLVRQKSPYHTMQQGLNMGISAVEDSNL